MVKLAKGVSSSESKKSTTRDRIVSACGEAGGEFAITKYATVSAFKGTCLRNPSEGNM
jgi:hypothetical protein